MWGERLEESRNEILNHIPDGFYNDLIDDINLNETVCDNALNLTDCGAIIDGVSGFSNNQIFSLLSPSTTSVNQLTTLLIQQFLDQTNSTEQEVIDLLNSY